ncbi:DUF6053 domain-containing protein [Lysobacter enzymogenes]|uniref:DUF6053 domain-containing protein n=1 Tax=Lysobacter enzymogenes TaxID=69 RepID=UPI00374963EF
MGCSGASALLPPARVGGFSQGCFALGSPAATGHESVGAEAPPTRAAWRALG